MDKRIAIGLIVVSGIVGLSIGYRQGVSSMVREWQRDVAPSLANYLAAKDAVENVIRRDEDD